MTFAARQLPLPFPHRTDYATGDFLAAASNRQALAWLDRVDGWPDHRIALWGEAGCGKTHLLHVWARRTGATLCRGPDLAGLPPPPNPAGMAVDDAAAAGEEATLLHLLNACHEAAIPVLLAAREPPTRWDIGLPDLASRLRAIAAVEITRPDDDLLRELLARLLADRQLSLAPMVRDWLLARLPRSPAALRDAIAHLDHAALAAGGRITRTLAATALRFDEDRDDSATSETTGGYGHGIPLSLSGET
jgi:chromosomal replication initiation ATPase DnaA